MIGGPLRRLAAKVRVVAGRPDTLALAVRELGWALHRLGLEQQQRAVAARDGQADEQREPQVPAHESPRFRGRTAQAKRQREGVEDQQEPAEPARAQT